MSTHTPGPWKWHQSHDGTSLRTPDRGQLIVMDVSESGELRFARRGPADRGGWLQEARVMVIGPRPLKTGFHDIDNPDARLIAAAPDAYAIIRAEYDSHNGFKTLPIGYPPERAEAITAYIRKVEGQVQP